MTGIAPIQESTTRTQETIQRGLEQFLQLVHQQHLDSDKQLAASLDKLRKRAASNEITLTVLGEFSAGKTTFINSLLGTDVLQTGILPTTATCTYISYGPTATSDVVLRNGAIVTISPIEVRQFSVEGSRAAEVESVRLRLPSSLLQQGLIVVDTPGVNVNIEEHEALTAYAISESNACVYLMDARQPGKKTTIDFLRRIHGQIDKFFFVLNRADILEANEQETAVEFVTEALKQECGIPAPRVALLSSTVGGIWADKFVEFKQHLSEFMRADRELLVYAELARLLRRSIAVSEELLQSKYRLIEHELAAHYEIALPNAAEITEALQRDLEEQIGDDSKAIQVDFTAFHAEVCGSLRATVEGVIDSAGTIGTLVNYAPAQISTAFQAHAARLQRFLSGRFEDMFAGHQTQVIAAVTTLFSSVKRLEQQAFFLRSGLWLAIISGAVLVPLIEWISGISHSALWISPFLGASLAGIAYGIFYWARYRSSFASPVIPRLDYAGCAVEAITSGATYKKKTQATVIGELIDAFFSFPRDKLRNEIRDRVAPVLDDFVESSRKNGLDTIEKARRSILQSLVSVTEKYTERYSSILERLLIPQRKIREALEVRRKAITTDVARLRELHSHVLSAYRELCEKLKPASVAYVTRDGVTEDGVLQASPAYAQEHGESCRTVRLLNSTIVARKHLPKQGLTVAWVLCCFISTVLLVATLHLGRASDVPSKPDLAPQSMSIASISSSSQPDVLQNGTVTDIRPPVVSLLNPPVLPRTTPAKWDSRNIQGTFTIQSSGPDVVIAYPNGVRFTIPTALYSPSAPPTTGPDSKVGTLELDSSGLSANQEPSNEWTLPFAASALRDINGDGWPEVVLSDYSGGAHCCTHLTILSLRPNGPVCVFSEDLGSASATFADLDGDGRQEISTHLLAEYGLGTFASGTYGIPVIYGADTNGAYVANTRAFGEVIRGQLEKQLAGCNEQSSTEDVEERDSTLINLFFLQYLAGNKEAAYSSLKALVPNEQLTRAAMLTKVEGTLRAAAPEILNEPKWASLRAAMAEEQGTTAGPAPFQSGISQSPPIQTVVDPRTAVAQVIQIWVESFRNKDAGMHASCYAPLVETYFRLHNVSNDRILRYKQQAFLELTAIRRYDVSDLTISPAGDGRLIAQFIKDWDTPSIADPIYAGRELEKLTFANFSGTWKIVAEEEVRILQLDRPGQPLSIPSKSISPPETKTNTLTGTYAGRVHNMSVQLWAAFSATVLQEGDALSGCLFVHRPLYGSGQLSGESRLSQVTFAVPSSIGVIRFTGIKVGNGVNGTYVVQRNGTPEYGEFELDRQGGLPADFNTRNCPDDHVVH